MFSHTLQPSLVSLFSSTSSDALALFRTSSDPALPSDSFIHFIHDGLSIPPPPSPGVLLHLPTINDQGDQDDTHDHGYKYGHELDQTVLHIQSPTIQTTFIQCPPTVPNFSTLGLLDRSKFGLGIKHPWMYLQVRNLGRNWAFEVSIVDNAGRVG